MDQAIKGFMYSVSLLILLSQNLTGQTFQKTMRRLPDTGQTKSYTNTWGEDSDYLIQVPAYMAITAGIVLDTVTGLMWQKSDSGELTYEKAIQYADTLQLGGFSDWRLPSASESFSLMNHQNPNPALDGVYFTKTGAEYWWTKDKQANDANKVWVTNGGGGIGNHAKTETISAGGTKKFHARCVRSVQNLEILPGRWTDHADGSITDHSTELMWVKSPTSGLNWEEALLTAENLSIAGYSDWRLPNIKELRSLSQEDKWNPSVDKTIFTQITTGRYWSSTSLPNQTTKAWFWDTQYGITTYEVKTLAYNALFVRSAASISHVKEDTDVVQLQVSPNPCDRWMNVSGLKDGDTYIIYNLSGQKVDAGFLEDTLDTSPLNPGYFILEVRDKNGKAIRQPFTKQYK